MKNLVIVLIGLDLLGAAHASPKVVNMQLSRVGPRGLSKRGTVGVDAVNLNEDAMYRVNVEVGNPPQPIGLLLDTGSSDTWMFGPNSCDTNKSPCFGGDFDISMSSSASLLDKGGFHIRYGGPGSNVVGDFFGDDLNMGGIKVKNLTMAVATNATAVTSGVLGIGVDTREYSAMLGNLPYGNILDEMLDQGFISSRSYSVWLDGLNATNGNILFGGYDTGKFEGKLAAVPIQPSPSTADGVELISFPNITWTSLSLNDSSGSTKPLTPADFSKSVILDTGSFLTSLPNDLYFEITNTSLPEGGWMNFPCSALAFSNLSVNFGFGGPSGLVIPVPLSEFALPAFDKEGKQLTAWDGSPGCFLGIYPNPDNDTSQVFGETFLRSAYVVFNFDDNQISMAPARLSSGMENVVEIKGSKPKSSSGPEAKGGDSVSDPKTGEGVGKYGTGRVYLPLLIALAILVVGGLQ